ncbi:MAG TPA: hypothetical protein VIP77_08655 [Jiangellaceae bacterium]
MAITGGIPVEFGQVFPHGAFVVGAVEPINDFERSTKDNPVQDRDKTTGMPLWSVTIVDGDEDARKGQQEISVKIAAEHQPVPPEKLAGLPFRPVELTGLVVMPWIEDRGPKMRARLQYSYRASGMQKPGGKPAPAGKDQG